MAVFVDTNVLVYDRDTSERDKQPIAHGWLAHLWETRSGHLSMQVLQEYYHTVTRRLSAPLDRKRARSHVRRYLLWRPVMADGELFEDAWRIEGRFRLSFWDSLIVAAARATGSSHLLTEDLQDGQDFDGVVVVDPFAHEPGSIG